MIALAKAYEAVDASLAEINPFILTKDGKVFALDAKINLDDNALYRHKDLLELRDLNEEDPLEVEASRFGLNYIKLDGTVGCMVNGAGLAMATMDIIKYAGGSPANFLDVGGGASAEQIQNAFRILLSDKNVQAVLINIFGGILRCDTLATGVVAAARELKVKVPIVVRMEGTNVELGRKILTDSGLELHRGRRHEGRRRESGEAGDAMSILVDKNTRLIVQGFTGQGRPRSTREQCHRLRHQDRGRRGARQGRHHAPGPARSSTPWPRPCSATGANASVIFVPPPFAADAIMEAADAGLAAGGLHHRRHPRARHGARLGVPPGHGATRLIGPNCPGIISPGKCKIGIMPGHIHKEGNVGVVSRSGTLTYEAVDQLTQLRHRPVHLHRHRRRPDHRHQFHRRHPAVQRGPGHATPS